MAKLKENIKKIFRFIFVKHRKWTIGISLVLMVLYAFCLPRPLFKSPTSIVLEDKEGNLLGAGIAKDEQWRFPYSENIPDKFEKSIIEFEDRRFHYHLGIDPKGIARAMEQNIRNQEVVSGGSTISMQVIRMARGSRRRNVWNKIIEAILATRLELGNSKKKILAYYASNAPFGGNVVGLDAASWRYYGKRPDLLSWGEAATLAVLPNSPALIHPGRNRQALLDKRNRLLDRLEQQGEMDSITCSLAKSEPLPDKPLPLPRLAPHLLDRVAYEHFYGKKYPLTRMKTTIDPFVQSQTNNILLRHKERLAANGIHNACVMIMDVESGDILSYVGNMPFVQNEHSPSVDIIKAPRSTGSILKPFLYAAMMDEGSILPDALISDVPTQMGNYRPMNYYETYDGAVPASRALVRSLNVPAIRMLQKYSIEKFHNKLKKMGMTTLTHPPSHYGLTLIVGGSEGNLAEITSMYASMARTVNHFYDYDGRYDPLDFRKPNYIYDTTIPRTQKSKLSKNSP
ncbi:MAG: penicillin-binding protein 1C, partial [Maribacter sp.]